MRPSNITKSSTLTAVTQEELSPYMETFQLLPGLCGQVVALYKYFGLGTREIANQLDITEGAVKRHLSRALIYVTQDPDGTLRQVPQDFGRTLYDGSPGIDILPANIVSAVAPHIIAAADALALRLKQNPAVASPVSGIDW
jgi:hypothetical protein